MRERRQGTARKTQGPDEQEGRDGGVGRVEDELRGPFAEVERSAEGCNRRKQDAGLARKEQERQHDEGDGEIDLPLYVRNLDRDARAQIDRDEGEQQEGGAYGGERQARKGK